MEDVRKITQKRLAIWGEYRDALIGFEREGLVHLPVVPDDCEHNAHMFYVLFRDVEQRRQAIEFLEQQDVTAVFHYVPLHSSPAGLRFGRAPGDMTVTDSASDRLLRLPLYYDMTAADTQRVIDALVAFVRSVSVSSPN